MGSEQQAFAVWDREVRDRVGFGDVMTPALLEIQFAL